LLGLIFEIKIVFSSLLIYNNVIFIFFIRTHLLQKASTISSHKIKKHKYHLKLDSCNNKNKKAEKSKKCCDEI